MPARAFADTGLTPSVAVSEAARLASALPPLKANAERLTQSLALGSHSFRRSGEGERFWQYREYTVSDPASRIDWRKSAKGMKVFVREKEWQLAQYCWLWQDTSASMDYQSPRAPYSKRAFASLITLTLAELFAHQHERVRFLGTPVRRIAVAADHYELAELLLTPTNETDVLPVSTVIRRNSLVVLTGDFLSDPEPVGRFMRLLSAAGCRGLLIQVQDPVEPEFPFSGRTRFLDPEGQGAHEVGQAAAIRDSYRQAYETHFAALQGLVAETGWQRISVKTDQALLPFLLSLYPMLGAAHG